MNGSLHHPYGGNLQHKTPPCTFSCLFLCRLIWHTWNTISDLVRDKLTGRVGITKQSRTPDLTLICYFKAFSQTVRGNSGYKKAAIHLGFAGQWELLLPKLLLHPMHCWVTAQGWHQIFKKGNRTFKINNCSWQNPGLSQPCMCSTSTSCWSREMLWHPWAGQSNFSPSFCTLMKQKWLQQGSNDRKAQTEIQGIIRTSWINFSNRTRFLLSWKNTSSKNLMMICATSIFGTAKSLPWQKLKKQNIRTISKI